MNTVVRVSGDTPVVVSQLACYVPREGFVVPVRTRKIIDLDVSHCTAEPENPQCTALL